MKKFMLITLVICFLFTACSSLGNQKTLETKPEGADSVDEATESSLHQEISSVTEQAATASPIYSLPDHTMDNLSDAILSISLEEGNVSVDSTGEMQMNVTIYTYDKYDLVDVSRLKVGDTLVTHAGEVAITAIEREQNGNILINGGLYEDGVTLITDETGVFYESGYNDAKNWYETGVATIGVSADFVYRDTSDLDRGEILYDSDSFLSGEVTDYHFTPYNTTIRVENDRIIEMYRVYIP